jgi:hypothetical protein
MHCIILHDREQSAQAAASVCAGELMTARITLATVLAVSVSVATVAADQAAKPKSSPAAAAARLAEIGKLNISGNPTHVACVGGNYYNQHALGFVQRGTRIRVDVVSGDSVDPVASIVLTQMGPNAANGIRVAYAYDDDSGGGRDPRLDSTAEFDGNVVVNIGSYDGAAGCYALKVELQVP